MFQQICQQVPSMTVVMHHLGIFDYWHLFNVTDSARVFCWLSRI